MKILMDNTTKNNITFTSKTGKITIFNSHIEYQLLPTADTPSLKDLQKELDFMITHLKGKKLPLLGDNRNLKNIDPNLVNFMREKSGLFTNKAAILVNPGISKFLFHSMLLIKKTDYPIKAFTNKQKALNWLLNNEM